MCCHPAEGGATARLARGSTPSTPRRRRSDKRRMSIKKFFRVTPEESAAIAASAAEAGIEQASYMRVQVLGKSKVRKARRIRADWDELRRCMGVINRAGNVVNQLVPILRRLAAGDEWAGMAGLAGMVETASAALAELVEAARAIVAALREL